MTKLVRAGTPFAMQEASRRLGVDPSRIAFTPQPGRRAPRREEFFLGETCHPGQACLANFDFTDPMTILEPIALDPWRQECDDALAVLRRIAQRLRPAEDGSVARSFTNILTDAEVAAIQSAADWHPAPAPKGPFPATYESNLPLFSPIRMEVVP